MTRIEGSQRKKPSEPSSGPEPDLAQPIGPETHGVVGILREDDSDAERDTEVSDHEEPRAPETQGGTTVKKGKPATPKRTKLA